jgi:3-methyladenine DNA glycosylase AlkD
VDRRLSPHQLVRSVRETLEAAGNPHAAERMRAYMKSALPFHGVAKRARRAALEPVFAAHPIEGWDALSESTLALWRSATHREERYAALDLARRRQHRAHWTPRALPLLDELVVSGAWWDLVDEIATKLLRAVLESDGQAVTPVIRRWARGEDLWRRRAAILVQIGRKDATDRALLEDVIAPSLDSKELFLRKAIGWSLRELSRFDPAWVRTYVREHEARLSGLSRREALRRIDG